MAPSELGFQTEGFNQRLLCSPGPLHLDARVFRQLGFSGLRELERQTEMRASPGFAA